MEYRKVVDVELTTSVNIDDTKTHAFVKMSQDIETNAAIEALDGAEWMGYDIEVRIATTKDLANTNSKFKRIAL